MDARDIPLEKLKGRRIFISFRRRDEPQVAGLATLLKNIGNDVTQMGDFPAGRWSQFIYKSLSSADTLLVYLTRAPELSRLGRAAERIGAIWRKLTGLVRRGPAAPADWMREECNYFRQVHGPDGEVIVFAEEDADKPDYLREQQFHFYVSQLTGIRQKWTQMRKDNVASGEARRIILADLKALGVDLDDRAASVVLDMFGVYGLRSAARYIWARSRLPLTFAPFAGGLALLGVAGFEAGQRTADQPVLVPEHFQATIGLGENGRTACAKQDMVCVSVSQHRVVSGRADDNRFYGYATPTCESRLKESNFCRSLGWDYVLDGVFYQQSVANESGDIFPEQGNDYCWPRPSYQFANCVAPLGR